MLLETLIAFPLPAAHRAPVPTAFLQGLENLLFAGHWQRYVETPEPSPAAVLARLYAAVKGLDPAGQCALLNDAWEVTDILELEKPLPELAELPPAWQAGLGEGALRFSGNRGNLQFTLSGRLLSRVPEGEPALRLVLRAVWKPLFPKGGIAVDSPVVAQDPAAEAVAAPEHSADASEPVPAAADSVTDAAPLLEGAEAAPASPDQDLAPKAADIPPQQAPASSALEPPGATAEGQSAQSSSRPEPAPSRLDPDPDYEKELLASLEVPQAFARLRAWLLHEGADLTQALLAGLGAFEAPAETRARLLVLDRTTGMEGLLRGFSLEARRSLVALGQAFAAIRPPLEAVYRLEMDGELLVWRGQDQAILPLDDERPTSSPVPALQPFTPAE